MSNHTKHIKRPNRLWRLFLNSKLFNKTASLLQNKQFLGYKGISWYSVLEFFIKWIDKRELQLRATSLSFTFFLALFPSIIFIFTLIAYTPLGNSHKAVLLFFEQLLPITAYKAAEHTLLDILSTQRGGLLSFGFLTAIYFSTNGFVSLMNILNRSDQRRETRSFWKKRIVAIILAIIVSISLLLAVILLTVGNFTINYLNKLAYFPSKITPVLLVILNIAVVTTLVLLFISLIYYLAPALHRKFKFISPGSVFACVSILVTTLAFSSYINQFNTYNKVYGSIGALIVVMLLIYINTYILLLGYEFNIAVDKTVSEIKQQRKIVELKTNRLFVTPTQEYTDEFN
jgi:membrane protein